LELATIPDNMQDYFLFDLLEGRLTDPTLIEERFQFFKWDIMGRGMVQVVSIQRRDGDVERDNQRFRDLVEQLSNAFPVFKTFAYGNRLKILCPVSEGMKREDHAIRDLMDFLERQDMVAGVSRPLNAVQYISDFNRQAEKAAELGTVFHPEKRVHFYDDHALYHALELCSQKEDALQFCHSAIIRLRDYDQEHDTNLLESLRVYLTHNRSIGESSSLLYIHRNTMNYRIAKIQELTDSDLDDPEVFSHLLFSFFALDFRAHQTQLPSVREGVKRVAPPRNELWHKREKDLRK
jgi:sugar diacid utilization regulator